MSLHCLPFSVPSLREKTAHLGQVVLQQGEPALQHSCDAVHIFRVGEAPQLPHNRIHLLAQGASEAVPTGLLGLRMKQGLEGAGGHLGVLAAGCSEVVSAGKPQ